jgi:hypothetical protein
MRVAAAVGVGLGALGAAVTWAADSRIAGTTLIIAGMAILLALVLLWPVPPAAEDAGNGEPTHHGP